MPGIPRCYQLSGLVVRVSALRLGGRGSIPGRVIPKTWKNGSQCRPARHSASRVGLAVGGEDAGVECSPLHFPLYEWMQFIIIIIKYTHKLHYFILFFLSLSPVKTNLNKKQPQLQSPQKLECKMGLHWMLNINGDGRRKHSLEATNWSWGEEPTALYL